jgi:hypothetical protein
MTSWRDKTYTLAYLRRSASINRHHTGALPWLQQIGVLPSTETRYPTKCWRIKTDLNPAVIPAEYIVASAAEWDSWGPSTPLDFMRAIEAECAGEDTHDLISGVLTTLGREALMEANA